MSHNTLLLPSEHIRDHQIIQYVKIQDLMTGHDQVFCLLGTTRAKSGKEGFVKVDKGLDKTLTAISFSRFYANIFILFGSFS